MFICLYIISFVLFIIAFITLVSKKEGSLKKAIIEFIISILTAILGCYIQVGYDYIANVIINKTNYIETSENKTEHIHTDYMTIKENIVNPTCVNVGSYELVTKCKCGEELNREFIILQDLGHNYINVTTEPTCVDRGFITYTCNKCNDTYIHNYIDALGHDYEEGVCIRCGYSDPNYAKIYDSEEIMKILSNSIVSDTGAYEDYLGAESISVFAEDRYNCFSISTAVSYNLWGHEVQSVIFNISDINELDTLNFDVGGETGSSGSMKVEIFVDKTFDDIADYTYELEASSIPTNISINIKNATSLSIRVTNCSNNQNKLVFFNFSQENK